MSATGTTGHIRECVAAFGRAFAVLALVVCVSLVDVSPVLAHASLISSSPSDGVVLGEAPDRFALEFNEAVSPLVLRLVRPDGAAAELGDAGLSGTTLQIPLPPDLGDGTHVLSWRVVSEDGHPVAGSVVFSIGAAGASPPVVAEAVDWPVRIGLWAGKVALYVGLIAGVGGAFALAWLAAGASAGTVAVAAFIGIGGIGAVCAAGFHGLDALGVAPARIADPLVWRTGLGTSFGRTVVLALPALLAGLASLKARGAPARVLAASAIAAAGLALAASGHAAAAEPRWLTRPLVCLHVVAASFWVGALVPLATALRRGDAGAGDLLRRFSAAIPWLVGMLIVAGGVLAVIQVETPTALATTAYGRVLMLKLALLCALFGFAAFNRHRLTVPASRGDGAARRMLVRSIAAETALALMILATVAAWRFTPPPRALAIAAAAPASVHLHGASAMADVAFSPGRAGPMSVTIIVAGGDFGALDAREVTLVLANRAAGIEPIRRRADRGEGARWHVGDLSLPLPGRWDVRVDVLISDFEIAKLEGEIDIRP